MSAPQPDAPKTRAKVHIALYVTVVEDMGVSRIACVAIDLTRSFVSWDNVKVQPLKKFDGRHPESPYRVLRPLIKYKLDGHTGANEVSTIIEAFQNPTGKNLDYPGGNGHLKSMFGVHDTPKGQGRFPDLFTDGTDGVYRIRPDVLSSSNLTFEVFKNNEGGWEEPTDDALRAIHDGLPQTEKGEFVTQPLTKPLTVGTKAHDIVSQPDGLYRSTTESQPNDIPKLPTPKSRDTREAPNIREEVRKRLVKILENHPKAMKYLFDEIFEQTDLSDSGKQDAIANHLLDMQVTDFLSLIRNAYKSHVEFADPTAVVYREIATYVLPQIYRKTFHSEFRACLNSSLAQKSDVRTEGTFLIITAAHESLIEILAAGVDGRPTMFADGWHIEADIPRGRNEVALVAPGGIEEGDGVKRFIRAFELGLRSMVTRLPSTFRDQVWAIRRKLVENMKLDPPTRFYYIYREGQGRVKELELLYPEIVFLLHQSIDRDDDGFGVLNCLLELYCPESKP